jgi:hypothetical protein
MTSIAAALALACTAVAMFAGSLLAQTGQEVYEACAPEKQEIRASALPEVVDEDRCPIEGRMIVDGGIGAVVPEPGMAISADATSLKGHQHLTVSNPRGDEVSLGSVGAETRSNAPSDLSTRASGPSPCQDGFYDSRGYKVYNYNRWYANIGSIPDNLSKKRVVAAMKKGGVNIFKVHDSCGIPDRVKGELRYQGGTSRSVDMDTRGNCTPNDGKSVIGFGDLPSGYTAITCVSFWPVKGAPDRVGSSDIRLNKEDHSWTAQVTSSCQGRQDIESTVTHERGHTFGLDEAPESSHGNLTMSSQTNGDCQISERSLGRGDAKGLNSKY